MALQCNYEKFGLTFNQAYARVEHLKYSATPNRKVTYPDYRTDELGNVERGQPVVVIENKKICNVIVQIYASEEARLTNEKPIDSKDYYIEMESTSGSMDILQYSYQHLKTLTEFSGSVDI